MFSPIPKSAFEQAHQRIRPYIHRTPVLTSKTIDQMAGAEIYFKCENFQKVGAFKARGGINAVLSLDDEEKSKGVATHSSGNHAQAIALAAKIAGINAWIVMPENAPDVKKAAVSGYGAHIIECEPTLAARESTLQKVMLDTGAVMVHPYNDYRIIAGQGTAAKELIEDTAADFDAMMAPIGGGGLIAGTALVSHYLTPNTKVIGAEPEAADDAYRSFKSGRLQTNTTPTHTLADGLLTNLGEKNFQIIKTYVDDILLVNDQEMMNALKLIWERMKIIVEPSCAVPLAAILRNKTRFQGKKIGVILSGGNVDFRRIQL